MKKADKFNRHYLRGKRKLLFTAFTFILGISLFGCGKKEKQDEGQNEGTVQGMVEQSDTEKPKDTKEENSFSGDYTQPEKWGYAPYWLKYGLDGSEKKDLSTLTIFDCVTDGLSLNDVLHSPKFTYYELKGYESDNIDDVINNGYIDKWDDSNMLSYGSYAEIQMYKEKDGDYIVVTIYNLSDESKTLAQCIEGNQFYVGDNNQVRDDTSVRMAFGIETKNVNHWETLDSLCDLLGRPDQVYYTINSRMGTDREDNEDDETFEETVEKGGGFIIYDMMYQLDHGKLFVGVTEMEIKPDDPDAVHVCYCTDALYEYLRDETNSGALVDESRVYDFE